LNGKAAGPGPETLMWYAIGTIAALIIVIALIRRRNSTPSLVMYVAIGNAVADLQGKALRQILPDKKDDAPGRDEDAVRELSIVLHHTIRFIYTIERSGDDFLHVISSRLTAPRTRDYQIRCMLHVMLVLNAQLADAGIKSEEVQSEVVHSDTGVQYYALSLSPPQHKLLAASATGAK